MRSSNGPGCSATAITPTSGKGKGRRWRMGRWNQSRPSTALNWARMAGSLPIGPPQYARASGSGTNSSASADESSTRWSSGRFSAIPVVIPFGSWSMTRTTVLAKTGSSSCDRGATSSVPGCTSMRGGLDHPRFAGRRAGGRRRRALGVERLDLGPGACDDLAQPLEPLGVVQRAARAVAEQSPAKLLHLVHQVGHLGPLGRLPAGGDPLADVVDRRLLVLEVAPTLVGDGVDLLALLLARADIAEVLEHLQRGVHRARAGTVVAAHAVLEGADDVVAVARLVLEQLEDDVLEVAATEQSLAWTAEAAPAATPAAERPVGTGLGVRPALVGSEEAEAEMASAMRVWSEHGCRPSLA